MPHVDLLELPYFEGISMDGLVSLVDLMQPKGFLAGEVLMREGDPMPQPLFIVTNGKLLICKKGPDGRQRRLAELDGPTLFGEIELFCEIAPVCTARAVTDLDAFTLDRPTFEKLFDECSPALLLFTFNVARVASHRLAIADELLAQVLGDEDLVELRRMVWTRMNQGNRWKDTTGAFRRQEDPPR